MTTRVRKPSQTHWRLFWEQREAALDAPSVETAERVWKLLKDERAGIRPAELLPPFLLSYCNPSPAEELELIQSAQRAFVAALDVFVRACQDRRTVSFIRVFDTLAGHWSPHFHRAQKDCPGIQSVRDMKIDTVQAIREDLLYLGISVEAIWKYVAGEWSAIEVGRNPLYRIVGKIPKVGYRVRRRHPKYLQRFEAIVSSDMQYERPPERRRSLLFASDPIPEREIRQKFAGEQPYNIVEVGKRAEETLDRLEQVQLVFNVRAFKADYLHYLRIEKWRRLPWEHRAKYPHRRKRARRAEKYVERFARVWDQVQAISSDHVMIHSGFFRAINRRFHARHFWVEHVNAKADRHGTSQRERWFEFEQDGVHVPMAGYDVSALQTQILAVFLGLRDLERLASDPRKPFKDYLSEQAWQAHEEGRLPLRAGYKKAKDIVPLVKTLWTRHLYGSDVRQIVRENHGWIAGTIPPYEKLPKKATRAQKAAHTRRKRIYNAAVAEATAHVKNFLADLPWYGKPGEGQLSDWFRACARIAQVCQRDYPYQGAEFVDPYDRKLVRFNPVRRARYKVSVGHQTLYTYPPGSWMDKAHTEFRRADRDPVTEDYSVSGSKLRRDLAPALVHMLDAALSAQLLDWLPHLSLQSGTIATGSIPRFPHFVALHDCWLIPETTKLPGSLWLLRNNLAVLSEMIQNAAMEWFRGLEVVYDHLVEYLGDDPKYGQFVHRIRDQWRIRKSASNYPQFAVSGSPSKL